MRLVARDSFFSELIETWRDLSTSILKLPLANTLAVQDILVRYRGSVIGPWWITISMGVLILGIGTSYAALFHMEVKELLPYVAIGLVFWGFISSSISEGGDAFMSAGAILRQSALPLPLFIFRCIIRNYINLAHQIIIVIGVLAWFRIFPGFGAAWSLVGLFIVTINIGWLNLALAMVSARFRDVPQIVTAILQFVFFLTPIFWVPVSELQKSPSLLLNPFYFSIQLIREPLLHGTVSMHFLQTMSLTGLCGWVAALLLYNQSRRRVVHYL